MKVVRETPVINVLKFMNGEANHFLPTGSFEVFDLVTRHSDGFEEFNAHELHEHEFVIADFSTSDELSNQEYCDQVRDRISVIDDCELLLGVILQHELIDRELVQVIDEMLPNHRCWEAIPFTPESSIVEAEPNYRSHSVNNHRASLMKFRRNLLRLTSMARLGRDAFLEARDISEKTARQFEEKLALNDLESQFNVPGPAYDCGVAYFVHQPVVEKVPRLVIFFNGAIDPERAQGRPVFQRKSWWQDFQFDSAGLADPTQTVYPDLALGWGQGTAEHWGVVAMVGAVRGISTAWRRFVDISQLEGRVLLYGTSGGGFQALAVGAFVPVERVIVNNPQIDWLRYEGRKQVKAVMNRVYGPYSDRPGFREEWSERISVLSLWESVGHAPDFDYVVNSESRSDLENQVSQLLKFWARLENTKLTNNSSLHFYRSPSDGHNPLRTSELFEYLGEMG